jgi:hypothetical protein
MGPISQPRQQRCSPASTQRLLSSPTSSSAAEAEGIKLGEVAAGKVLEERANDGANGTRPTDCTRLRACRFLSGEGQRRGLHRVGTHTAHSAKPGRTFWRRWDMARGAFEKSGVEGGVARNSVRPAARSASALIFQNAFDAAETPAALVRNPRVERPANTRR